MNKTVILGLLILTGLFSCASKENIHKPVNDLTKSLLDFRSGSYWVMADSISGRIDSFYLDKYLYSVLSGSGVTYESIQYALHEVNTANNLDTAEWSVFIPSGGSSSRILLHYNENKIDSVRSFYAFDIDMTRNQNLSINGTNFQNTYSQFNLMGGGKYPPYNTDTISITLNQQFGFVQLKLNIQDYKHNWVVLRSVLNRS